MGNVDNKFLEKFLENDEEIADRITRLKELKADFEEIYELIKEFNPEAADDFKAVLDIQFENFNLYDRKSWSKLPEDLKRYKSFKSYNSREREKIKKKMDDLIEILQRRLDEFNENRPNLEKALDELNYIEGQIKKYSEKWRKLHFSKDEAIEIVRILESKLGQIKFKGERIEEIKERILELKRLAILAFIKGKLMANPGYELALIGKESFIIKFAPEMAEEFAAMTKEEFEEIEKEYGIGELYSEEEIANMKRKTTYPEKTLFETAFDFIADRVDLLIHGDPNDHSNFKPPKDNSFSYLESNKFMKEHEKEGLEFAIDKYRYGDKEFEYYKYLLVGCLVNPTILDVPIDVKKQLERRMLYRDERYNKHYFTDDELYTLGSSEYWFKLSEYISGLDIDKPWDLKLRPQGNYARKIESVPVEPKNVGMRYSPYAYEYTISIGGTKEKLLLEMKGKYSIDGKVITFLNELDKIFDTDYVMQCMNELKESEGKVKNAKGSEIYQAAKEIYESWKKGVINLKPKLNDKLKAEKDRGDHYYKVCNAKIPKTNDGVQNTRPSFTNQGMKRMDKEGSSGGGFDYPGES